MTYAFRLLGDTSMHRSSRPTSRRRRGLALRLAALAGLAALVFPSRAEAEDRFAGGGGIYVSFTFGDELGVGYGAEASLMGLVKPEYTCSSATRAGAGALVQLGLINFSKFRWIVAAEGGGQVDGDESVGFLGELGGAGHVALDTLDPSFGVHTGFLTQTPYYVTAFLRAEWLLDDYSVGHSVRFPGSFGLPNTCVDGRPLRTEEGVVPGVEAWRGPMNGGAMPSPREAAEAWAHSAQAEAASVPAFLQLASELLVHDAPTSLIERALDAAEEEIRHAQLCARMATRLSGRDVRAVLPESPMRAPLGGSAGLARLAVESWLDGCLGEEAAAHRAAHAARVAGDPSARETQSTIAKEEKRHAELGWRILAWALERGGDDVAQIVRAARDVSPPEGAQPDGLDHWGIIDRENAQRIDAARAANARRRLDATLSAS
jgi:hypothetical protein